MSGPLNLQFQFTQTPPGEQEHSYASTCPAPSAEGVVVDFWCNFSEFPSVADDVNPGLSSLGHKSPRALVAKPAECRVECGTTGLQQSVPAHLQLPHQKAIPVEIEGLPSSLSLRVP